MPIRPCRSAPASGANQSRSRADEPVAPGGGVAVGAGARSASSDDELARRRRSCRAASVPASSGTGSTAAPEPSASPAASGSCRAHAAERPRPPARQPSAAREPDAVHRRAPARSRSSFTGCSCSSIWISFASAAGAPRRRPRPGGRRAAGRAQPRAAVASCPSGVRRARVPALRPRRDGTRGRRSAKCGLRCPASASASARVSSNVDASSGTIVSRFTRSEQGSARSHQTPSGSPPSATSACGAAPVGLPRARAATARGRSRRRPTRRPRAISVSSAASRPGAACRAAVAIGPEEIGNREVDVHDAARPV